MMPGQRTGVGWWCRGASINTDVNTSTSELISTEQTLQIIFEWFFANGGTGMRQFRISVGFRF